MASATMMPSASTSRCIACVHWVIGVPTESVPRTLEVLPSPFTMATMTERAMAR